MFAGLWLGYFRGTRCTLQFRYHHLYSFWFVVVDGNCQLDLLNKTSILFEWQQDSSNFCIGAPIFVCLNRKKRVQLDGTFDDRSRAINFHSVFIDFHARVMQPEYARGRLVQRHGPLHVILGWLGKPPSERAVGNCFRFPMIVNLDNVWVRGHFAALWFRAVQC